MRPTVFKPSYREEKTEKTILKVDGEGSIVNAPSGAAV
jgi:hypothetical protein